MLLALFIKRKAKSTTCNLQAIDDGEMNTIKHNERLVWTKLNYFFATCTNAFIVKVWRCEFRSVAVPVCLPLSPQDHQVAVHRLRSYCVQTDPRAAADELSAPRSAPSPASSSRQHHRFLLCSLSLRPLPRSICSPDKSLFCSSVRLGWHAWKAGESRNQLIYNASFSKCVYFFLAPTDTRLQFSCS